MNINWASIPQIFIGVAVFIQGILVIMENPHSSIHRAFFFLELPASLWMTGMGLGYLTNDPELALMLVKIGFVGVIFIPISTYYFSIYYVEDKKQLKILYVGLTISLILATLINHPLITLGLYKYSWGYYIKLGPLSYAVVGLFATFVPLFLRNFYIKYKHSIDEMRRWHLLALIIGGFAFMGVIDFIPAYGIPLSFPPMGFIFTGFLVTVMGYYILRHHLIDVKIIIGRTIGYIVLTYFLFIIYTGIFILFFPSKYGIKNLIFNAFIFIIALYILSFFKQKSQKMVDELFFKEKIDFQNLITQFTGQLRNLINTSTLLQSIFSFFSDTLRIQSSMVMIYQQRGRRWYIYESNVRGAYNEKRVNADVTQNILDYFIEKPRSIDMHDVAIAKQPRSSLEKIMFLIHSLKGEMVIPLVHHSTFFGFIILGKKLTSENYSKKEVIALNNLSIPFCIAWDNALLYENIQNSSKLKSDFVSVASHQLRTPLTSLKWAIKTLVNKELGPLSEDQINLLNNIYMSTDNMIQIVNQWLDIARIEEEKTKTSEESFSFTKIAQESFKEYAMLMKEKNINFSSRAPKNLPLVLANKNYMKTVLSILLENAILYTPKGGTIVFAVKKTPHNEIEASITDSGIGIPKKQEAYIFTKFFRAQNAVSAQPNGSGLGLFYAKTIIEKQGGNIWFRTKENKGTTFFFTLPAAGK